MDRLFKCQDCSKKFKSATELRRHQLVHTNIRNHLCDQCPSSFKLMSHLRRHQLTHNHETSARQTSKELASKAYGCSRCSKQFARWQDLTRHIGQVHLHQKYVLANGFRCNHCNSDFNSFAKLNHHRIDHGLKPRPSCRFCRKSFITTSALRLHLAAHESGEISERCGHCQLAFVSFRDLSKHMLSSHGEKVALNCHVCGRRFDRNWNLQQHLHTHSLVHPYRCSECPKAFNRAQALRIHQRTQHQSDDATRQPRLLEAKYRCSRCDKAFKCSQVLSGHLRVVHYVDSVPLRCTTCGCSFKSAHGLRKHLANHPRSVKAYRCGHCGERFTTFSRLKQHMLADHSLEIDIECQICHKSFNDNPALQRHLRQHSDMRPYRCQQCPTAFKYTQNLQLHERTCHARNRPNSRRFQCEACKARFASSAALLSHVALRRCNNDMRSCSICGVAFSLVAELHLHIARKHPAVIQQQLADQQQPCTYACSHCDKVAFFNGLELFRHIVAVHLNPPSIHKSRLVNIDQISEYSGRRFKCSQCCATFRSRYHMRRHETRHRGSKQLHKCASLAGSAGCPAKVFRCATCPAAFSSSDDLLRHTPQHRRLDQEDAFRCHHCNASFHNYAHLLLHQRWHAKPDQSFQCAVCSFSFKTRGDLRTHLLHRHGPKRFLCEQCPASFTHAAFLARHSTSHSSDRPYSCAVCSKTFKSKGRRNEHHRQHHPTGRDGKTARRKHTFRSCASLSQQSVMEYACHLCNAGFPLEAELDEHMAALHNKSSSQPSVSNFRQHQAAAARKSIKRHLPAEAKAPVASVKPSGSVNAPSLRSRGKPQPRNDPPSSPASSHSSHSALSCRESLKAANVRGRGRPLKVGGAGQKPQAPLVQPHGVSTKRTRSEAPKMRSRDGQSKTKCNASTSEAVVRSPTHKILHSSSASAVSAVSTLRVPVVPRKRNELTLANEQEKLRDHSSSESSDKASREDANHTSGASSRRLRRRKLSLSLRKLPTSKRKTCE